MKKIFVIIIIVCFSFLICGCSYEYKFGDFEFVGDRLTNYTGTDTEVIIPHAYSNGPKIIEVKYIDKEAFTGNSIIVFVMMNSFSAICLNSLMINASNTSAMIS